MLAIDDNQVEAVNHDEAAERRRYEVQISIKGGAWNNYAKDDDGQPITYSSYAEAYDALNAHAEVCVEAEKRGEDLPPGRIRVAPVGSF